MSDDYTNKYNSGYYGTGKGIGSAAYQQGAEARARDEAAWRASPNFNVNVGAGGAQSQPGGGAGLLLLAAVAGVLGMLWAARFFVVSLVISVLVAALVAGIGLRLAGRRMEWRGLLVHCGAAYGVAVASAIGIFLVAVGLADAGWNLVSGTEHVVSVGFVELPVPGPYTGLVAAVLGLMIGAWWLNRKLPAIRLHGFFRWVCCGVVMVLALWAGSWLAEYVMAFVASNMPSVSFVH